MAWLLLPLLCNRMLQSSVKPISSAPNWFIISMALLKAMIQNLALQTHPWGKPILIVAVADSPLCSVYRFLRVR